MFIENKGTFLSSYSLFRYACFVNIASLNKVYIPIAILKQI